MRPRYLTAAAAHANIGGALDRLFGAGLRPDASKRTAAGRLVGHLKSELVERRSGWDIDCVRDRLDLDQRVPQLGEMAAQLATCLGWSASFATRGRAAGESGLVVRGTRAGVLSISELQRLIVCEVKRHDASKQAIAADLVKLACYRKYDGFEHAFLVRIGDTRDACVVHCASTSVAEIAWYIQHLDEGAAVRRWKRGQELAAQRQRGLSAKMAQPPPAGEARSPRTASQARTTRRVERY
jgi:hypothetical protein